MMCLSLGFTKKVVSLYRYWRISWNSIIKLDQNSDVSQFHAKTLHTVGAKAVLKVMKEEVSGESSGSFVNP